MASCALSVKRDTGAEKVSDHSQERDFIYMFMKRDLPPNLVVLYRPPYLQEVPGSILLQDQLLLRGVPLPLRNDDDHLDIHRELCHAALREVNPHHPHVDHVLAVLHHLEQARDIWRLKRSGFLPVDYRLQVNVYAASRDSVRLTVHPSG